ncbi:MAG: glycosyltransferase family 4 protein [Candidatus Binatia bacterium]
MNIVMVAHFAGTPSYGMVYGHYYLAREWARKGHGVTILAASHAHTRFRQPTQVEETIDGIRYRWLKCPRYTPASSWGRVANILAFTMQVWRNIAVFDEVDLVICSSHHPLAIFPSRKLARKHRAKLVFEVRDLWPLTLIELGGASRLNPLIAAMQYAENYACKVADKVVSVLPYASTYMEEHGMSPDKFLYIPNGVAIERDEQEPLSQAHRSKLEALKKDGNFLIGYAGRVTLANALAPAVLALAKVSTTLAHLVILGDGALKGELQGLASRIGVQDRVTFLDPVPKQQVAAFLSVIDVSYLGLHQTPSLYRFGVSLTKLHDYLLAGKPVICASDTRVDAIEESGAGIMCKAGSPEEIAATIDRLAQMPQAECEKLGSKGREWVLRNRDYKVLAQRFLEGVSDARALRELRD